jgi:3',5'-cyclic AMP phosphodiesterase CpdA
MKIIQITDIHLVASGGLVSGVDPEARLRRVVADVVARHADADLLVVTGDLADSGRRDAYELLREILAPLPFPYRLLLGNHDLRSVFVEVFPEHPRAASGHVQSHLDTPHGRLLFLDSSEPGVIGGIYDAERLAWLDAALAEAGRQPVTVFVHHSPFDEGLTHFAHIGMHDGGAVRDRLKRHPGGVRHVVFGHVHVPMCGVDGDGLSFSSGQACAHQFITDPDDPAPFWTNGAPTYRVLRLGDFGFRAYETAVGLPIVARATPCVGP